MVLNDLCTRYRDTTKSWVARGVLLLILREELSHLERLCTERAMHKQGSTTAQDTGILYAPAI